MIYSIFAYITLMTILWFIYVPNFTFRDFEKAVKTVSYIIYLMIVVTIPMTCWTNARGWATYERNWTQFQADFLKGTGEMVSLSVRRRSVLLFLAGIALVISMEAYNQSMKRKFNAGKCFTNCYIRILKINIVIFWYDMCLALRTAAHQLTSSLLKMLESSPKSTYSVATYKTLWLQLSRLVRETGNATCNMYCFFILYKFVTLTLYMYRMMSTLLAGNVDIPEFTYVLVLVIMDVILLSTVCHSAYKVTQAVGVDVTNKLLNIRVSTRCEDMQYEMDSFLFVVVMHQPTISLEGFVTINNSLLVSIGSTMLTYFIVLLQFKLSLLSQK